MIVASGAACSQSREAGRQAADMGIEVGLVKIKSLRPFPSQELIEATEHAEKILVPEYKYVGWLAKEIKSTIGRNERVISGPHNNSRKTKPTELILEYITGSKTF